jgi:CubicO group peptidase (beta-lactamase class C family)
MAHCFSGIEDTSIKFLGMRTVWMVTACLVVWVTTYHSLGQELPTAKPEEVGVSSEKVGELSKFMQSLVDERKIAGGVTMMARHGKVIHLAAVGMADRETGTPMKTDAIFRIASMTKPITSAAIMMLWEQGKLGLDDPVSKYIPEFANPKVLVSADPVKTEPAKREITIRHLLTHTSGLGYNNSDKIGPIYNANGITGGLGNVSAIPLEPMMAKLGGLPLLFHPGEKWEYSLSTDVLGRVVEKASGTTLDRCLGQMIFQPLQMKDTFFQLPPEKASRLVSAYVPVEHGTKKLVAGEIGPEGNMPEAPYDPSQKYFSGGGGLCSTAADYMRFSQMLLNGGELNDVRLLKDETVALMSTNQIGNMATPGLDASFGFGFTIFPDAAHVHPQLRAAYAWFGYWSTSFRIAPRGDWILVTMAQVGWDDKVTPDWFSKYESIAADAVLDTVSK